LDPESTQKSAKALAEELAFRGFLMRRLISSDFESISFQRVTWVQFWPRPSFSGFCTAETGLPGASQGFSLAWRRFVTEE